MSKTITDEVAPLSFTEKLGYGIGDMAANLYQGFFGFFLLYFYTDVWGLAPAAVGVMLLISKAIDAVTDPAMGLIADRTNTRWGKYRPYLLWGAVPFGVLGYALFLGPDLSDSGKLVYAYVTYIGVWLIYTVVNVPYSALLAVISPIAAERTKATTYRFFCAGLGTLLVVALATPLTGWLGGGDEGRGFRLTMALCSVIAVVLIWVTFLTTRERIEPDVRHDSSVGEDFSALLRNVSWIVLSLAGVLLIIGIGSRAASIIFYVKYNMGGGEESVFLFFDKIAVFTSFGLVSQIIGTLLTPALVARFEKHQTILAMCLLHAILLAICYFIPVSSYWLIVGMHSLGYFTFGVCITLLFAMYTDCAEYGEWMSGKNTAGLTVSSSMFALKFGGAVGSAIPGLTLALFGFVANEVQSAEALAGIQLMFYIIPGVMFLLAAATISFYRIDRAMLRRLETELYARRHPGVTGDPVHQGG